MCDGDIYSLRGLKEKCKGESLRKRRYFRNNYFSTLSPFETLVQGSEWEGASQIIWCRYQ